MIVHLVDGTYEIFRCYFGLKRAGATGHPLGAARAVLQALLRMVEEGGTHFGVATDHVIESFRNKLWPGYKTGEGVEPALLAQFQPLEEALAAFGFAVWPMVELEADDALASAASICARDPTVEKVCIWTPDKDLAQCVAGERVVQVDRRGGHIRDEAAVVAKFGVPPRSIPDYLALVGDGADGYPGIKGWGAKSAAALFTQYEHLADIPITDESWRPNVANAVRLAQALHADWKLALLFLDLATLRAGERLFDSAEALRWNGPPPEARAAASKLGDAGLFERAVKAAARAASGAGEPGHGGIA